jgi:prepilin-type N-terminal cleavage/methylation domain-containing protein
MTGRERGFTLIELLIVVAIIGLLIVLLLPTIGMVQRTLELTECKTNLRNAHEVIMTYASTYKGLLPAFGMSTISEAQHTSPGGTPADHHLMMEALRDAGGKPNLFACPAHPDYEATQGDDPFFSWQLRRPNGDPAWRASGADSWIKYYSTPGYAWFMYQANHTRHPSGGGVIPSHWASWSRFLNGQFMPSRNDTPGNPPIGGDAIHVSNAYRGFWHYQRRQGIKSDTDEAVLEPGGGGHTLFLAGDVIWADWGELEAQGPAYEANDDDYYYVMLEKPGD